MLGILLSSSAEGQPAVRSRLASANDGIAPEDMIASLPSDVAEAARKLIGQPSGKKMCFSQARKCAYVLSAPDTATMARLYAKVTGFAID